MKRTLLKVLVVIVCGIIAFYKLYFSDRVTVRKIINEGKIAVETENVTACMSYISEDYSDDYENKKEGLEKATRNFFSDVENLKIKILKKSKKYNKTFLPDKCEVSLWLIAEASNKELGTFAGQQSVILSFKKQSDKKWYVVKLKIK